MSIQTCTVDKSRIARLIEYLLESVAFVSLVAENISPKFEIRSRADVCIRWTYRTCMRDVIAADMIATVHIYGTDSRAEESSSHPNKWTNPTLTVPAITTGSSIFHTHSITTSLLLGAGQDRLVASSPRAARKCVRRFQARGVVFSHDDA